MTPPPAAGMEEPSSDLAKGTIIWYHDDAQVWKSGTILNSTATNYEIELRPGEASITLPKTHPICLRNKDVFSSEGLVVIDDLTQLTHLNEPSVLHSLQVRFDTDKIYTFTGPILISLNPFKRLPGMYDDETLADFVKTKNTKKPHVFATANAAFQGICERQKCQTVLISGESGAGKTVSTKFVMKYLASAAAGADGERTEVEKQVLESNPLLEGFGNARTLRNDNSSRFGKFIELQFKPIHEGTEIRPPSPTAGGAVDPIPSRLCGARIHTYLLEKVRVSDQQEGERNYHIFYQCCAAASAYASPDNVYDFPQVNSKYKGPALKLDLRGFTDHAKFEYLCRSSVIALDALDDASEFEATVAAMKTVGFPIEEINAILNCVASSLLLGNSEFVVPAGNSEGSAMDPKIVEKYFHLACELMGVDRAKLELALTTKTISTRGETYVSPLGPSQAKDFTDALSRQLYGLLFLTIVEQANTSIGYLNNVKLFCGVLDIFGFECFRVNSFEQLCINFTNERLQQFFNTFVFKLEEELYKAEDIPWDPLDFPDNQDSVDLLADPRTGLFAMLDEECVVPQGSDKGYCNKIIAKHGAGQNKRFDIIKTKPDWFVVRHFAGPVQYASEQFLEKNKDQLSVPIYDVMKASTNPFIAKLFIEQEARRFAQENPAAASPNPVARKPAVGGGARESEGPAKRKKALTVSNEFKDQLNSLMETVNKTEPHFIRCIKPNPQNLPDIYDRLSVTEQLRYGGVLQAVQVSRAGYPVRANHFDIWLDYRYCLHNSADRLRIEKVNDARTRAQEMMTLLEVELKIHRHAITNSISWAVGKTLVFLKQEAHERLQSARLMRRNRAATTIQARYKGIDTRKWYAMAKQSIIQIQALMRGKLARLHAARLRRAIAAVFVQAVARMSIEREHYILLRRYATKIQSVWRGVTARTEVAGMKVEIAATKVQSAWRAVIVRRAYRALHAGVLQAQRSFRMREAKAQLRRLKDEAKEVGSLLAKFQTSQAELQEIKRKSDDLEGTKVHLTSRIEALEEDLKSVKAEEAKAKAEIVTLRAKLAEYEGAGRGPAGSRTPLPNAVSFVPVPAGPPSVPPLPVQNGTPTASSVSGENQSAVSVALDSFKNWLGVQRSQSFKAVPGSLGVLQSSLKGTKSMKAACKDPEAHSDMRPVQELQDGESAVTCICFGQEKIHRAYILLAAASKDGTVVIYRCYRTEIERLSLNDAEFPKEDGHQNHPSDHGNIVVHCRLTGHTRAITSLFFSLLEDMVVTTSIDKSVRFWNADSGEMLKVFTDSSPVPVACFLPFNPSVFVAANSNAVLRLVNATNGMVLQKLKVEAEVRALKFDDTGLFLMAGTKNGSVHVLEACDNSTLRFKFKLQLARGGITCITFVSAQNGQPPCLLVNSSDSSVTIVDCVYGPPGSVLINLNVRHRVKVAHSLLPLKCCYSPSDAGYLISGSEDKGVYVFSLAKGSNYKMHVLNHHQVPVVAVASNQQDTLLASADSLGRIVLWRRLDFTHLAAAQWQPTAAVM